MAAIYEEKITITVSKLIKNSDTPFAKPVMFVDGSDSDFEDYDPRAVKAELFGQLQGVIEETISALLEGQNVVVETTIESK